MRNLIILAFLLPGCFMVTLPAGSQSLKNLDENNGFKKYKLGSKFVMGLGIKQKELDGADKIVIDYSREMIGDIPIKSIELYYLRDTLSKIMVKVLPDYHEKLIDAVRNSFGQHSTDLSYNAKTKIDSNVAIGTFKNHFVWKAARINLQYYYNYPQTTGGAYGNKNLYLDYSLNDYAQRLQRSRKGASTAKNF